MDTLRHQLRQHFKAARRDLSPNTRQSHHRLIYQQLEPICAAATAPIFAYWSNAYEVDLADWLARQQTCVALPRIAIAEGAPPDPNNPVSMSFHTWCANEPMLANRFGILEPQANATCVTPVSDNVMLMPLVAFDAQGTRLGMGGGYYDRYLASITPRPMLIGVAYACQYSPEPLPQADWDIGLDAVVTEDGVLEFSSSSQSSTSS